MMAEAPQQPKRPGRWTRRSILRRLGITGLYSASSGALAFAFKVNDVRRALAGPEELSDPAAEKLRSTNHEPLEELKRDRFSGAERARSALQQAIVQAPFDVTLPPEAVYRRAQENARSHGYDIAGYLACRERLQSFKTPEERFEVLREFSRTSFKRDLRWADPSRITMSDVYAIYEGLVGLSLFAPVQVFDAVHAHMPPGPMQAFELLRSGHPRLEGAQGYALYPNIVVGMPLEETSKSKVVGTMIHEFAHTLEKALLPDMKRVVRANDPSDFGEMSFDYYEASKYHLGSSTVVAKNYGRVSTERFSTLAENFPFLDVASFEGFTTAELIPGSTSVRVYSFCLALAYYAKVIDGLDPSGKRDLLGYMLSMIVTPNRSLRQDCPAAEYAARQLIERELAPQLAYQQTTDLPGSSGKAVSRERSAAISQSERRSPRLIGRGLGD